MRFLSMMILFHFFLPMLPASVPQAQGEENRLIIADLAGSRALITGEAGDPQPATLSGQVVFQRTKEGLGHLILPVASFNLLVGGIESRQGMTGRVDLTKIGPGTLSFFNPTPMGGDFRGSLNLAGHYELIDKVVGFTGMDRQEPDQYDSPSEQFMATIRGSLILAEAPGGPGGSLDLQGDISLIGSSVLGAVRNVSFNVHLSIKDIALPPCTSDLVPHLRTIPVRPVYVRAGPTDSTVGQESYFTTELATANDVWGRCCVHFDALPPAYVNRPTLQTITADPDPLKTSAEETDLLDEFVEDDAIEVFVIESFSPESSHGGGATWGTGKATARVITAANNLPVNQRHLAHELGHVLSLCHPFSGCTAPKYDASSGSVMEGSGFYADNPNIQTAHNCEVAGNPLLVSQLVYCCPHPDVLSAPSAISLHEFDGQRMNSLR